MPFLAKYYGFHLPNKFSSTHLEQFRDGINILKDAGKSPKSLRDVQNLIWRRILINLPEIIKSKGTLHSLKALLRAAGVEPDRNFRFREFGGSTNLKITNARRQMSKITQMLEMGFNRENSVISPPLISQRTEGGKPIDPSNPIYDYPTQVPRQSWTRYSWTCEGRYKLNKSANPYKAETDVVGLNPYSQSLMKLMTTSLAHTGSQFITSSLGFDKEAYNVGSYLLANVVATPHSDVTSTGSVELFVRSSPLSESHSSWSPPLRLALTGVDIFDGRDWYVSFGRNSVDAHPVSSSYFLSCGTAQSKGSDTFFTTSSLYFDKATNTTSMFDTPNINDHGTHSKTYNRNGTYLHIGHHKYNSGFLISGSVDGQPVAPRARTTHFSGSVSNIRFWTKDLNEGERREHCNNFQSVGVDNPLVNYNFAHQYTSGSWERLRIDTQCLQEITSSTSSGVIRIFDHAQATDDLKLVDKASGKVLKRKSNSGLGNHLTGSHFGANHAVIKQHLFNYSILEPNWDQQSTHNHVRVRSWQNPENVALYGGEQGLVHEIPKNETLILATGAQGEPTSALVKMSKNQHNEINIVLILSVVCFIVIANR